MYGWKQPCTFSKLIDQSTIELIIHLRCRVSNILKILTQQICRLVLEHNSSSWFHHCQDTRDHGLGSCVADWDEDCSDDCSLWMLEEPLASSRREAHTWVMQIFA